MKTVADVKAELADLDHRSAAVREKMTAIETEIEGKHAEIAEMVAASATGERRFSSLSAKKDEVTRLESEREYLEDAVKLLAGKRPGLEKELQDAIQAERLTRYTSTREKFVATSTEFAALTEELNGILADFAKKKLAPVLERMRAASIRKALGGLDPSDFGGKFLSREEAALAALAIPVLNNVLEKVLEEAADVIERERREIWNQKMIRRGSGFGPYSGDMSLKTVLTPPTPQAADKIVGAFDRPSEPAGR